MKYIMLLPMLLACGDKEEEVDSASPDTEEVVQEEEQENQDTGSESEE